MMLDQVRDSNQAGMFQLNTLLDFPEFVKEATQTTPEAVKELDSNTFALPSQRLYPLHTAQDTWLSAAYFHKFGSELPEHSKVAVQKALEVSAKFWNIELPTFEDVQDIPKEASVSYDVKYPMGEGVVVKVVSADELEKVARDVMSGGKYPLTVRQEVARQALQAPEEFREGFGMDTVSDLQKIAGMGIGTQNTAISAIRQRWHAVPKNLPIREGLEELQNLIKTAANEEGLLSQEMTQKTASMLDAIDRFVGLHTRYNDSFRPAEQQLFDVTLQDYDQFHKLAVRLPTGEWVRKTDIESVIPFLEESFGQKCASVEDAVEYVRGMPERRSEIVSRHLQNQGVTVL